MLVSIIGGAQAEQKEVSSPLVRSLSQAHSLVPLAANDDCQEELRAQEVACQVRPERLCLCSNAGVKGVSYTSTGTAQRRFPHSVRLENGGPNTEQGPRVLRSWDVSCFATA